MSDEKQKALDGEMGIPTETTNEHDKTYENEGKRDYSPVSYTHLTLPTT